MTRQLSQKRTSLRLLPAWLLFIGLFMGLNQNLQAQLQVAFDVTDVLCFSLPQGSITASGFDGTPNYNYVWNTGQTGPTITGLVAGTYTVTVSDAGGQSIVRSAVVGEPDIINAVITADDICSSPFVLTAGTTGGVPGYSYNWGTGAMTPSITVGPGTYCVTVTDQNMCGSTDCITVEENAPTVSVLANGVTCPGGSDGSVTATPSGGLPPYVYTWSNGEVGQTIAGLSFGNYTVTLTDANGCSDTATGFVTQPAPINITLNPTSPSCVGDTNGSVSSFVSGGNPPYTLSWNTGQNTNNIFNLGPGTYTLTVIDSEGCINSAITTLNYLSNLTLGGLGTPETCPGANDGFATANPQNGVMPYTYQWADGFNEQVIQDAAPGNYFVTVTDAVGCVASTVINVPAAPAFTVIATNNSPSTCGASNGTATANIIEGQGPFSFAWNTGGNTQTITGLSPGTYSVVVTNGNGCVTSSVTTVVAPPEVFANVTATPILCPDASTGTATVNVTGGTAPFNFNWSTGAITQTINNLSAGTYSVIVTDANGCTDIAAATIAQSPGVTFDLTGLESVCGEGGTGSALAVPTSGTPPFSFLWSTGATSSSVVDLLEGTYSVIVTDANNCTASESITINIIDDLDVTVNGNGVLCAGFNTGSATAFPSGGNAPYSYAWNNGSNQQTINGLAPGTYTVVLTDANGCTTSNSYTVTAPAPLTVGITPMNPLNCFGEANASLTANANGGTPAYSYSWNTGATSQTISNLTAGFYTVTVTDANNCTSTASFTVNQSPAISVNVTGNTIVCGTINGGSAAAIVTGGIAPFSFLWSNGAITQNIGNLLEGTYSVVVTDGNNCTTQGSITINVIDDLDVVVNGNNILCTGVNTGSATALPSGGNAPYTYAWNNGSSQQTINGLAAGTYSVVVTDANGCTTNGSYTVTSPTPVTVGITPTDPLNCFGEANASLTANANGGTPAYSYSWNTGQTSQTINNLAAGFYTVTVTDVNGCTANASFTINQSPAITVNVTGDPTVCGSVNGGAATAVVTGGIAPFSFLWNNGATTQSINNLPTGTYSVVVTDGNNCTAQGSITIMVVGDFDATLIPRDVLCFGDNSGSVLAQPSGGTAPYTYNWSNGGNTNEILNLTAGTYTVAITDANGCTITRSASVGQPGQLGATATGTDPLCPGDANGTASLTVSGGTAPFSFAWNNGATTQNISGLSAGSYSATITDANLCTTTASVTLNDPQGLSVNVTSPTITCGGTSTGTATAIVAGGTPGYNYLWSDGQTTQTADNLPAGIYGLTVTDANDCLVTETTILVNELPAISVDFNITNLECTSNAIGSVTAVASNGTAPYSYAWNTGQVGATISGLTAGSYTVTVTDGQGCTAIETATVTQTNGFTAGVTGTNVTCNGLDNGSATVVVNGGTAPFAFQWASGQNTQTIGGLAPGTYTVQITDANECTGTASVIITEPTPLVANVSDVDIECGGNTGSATVTTSGGTAPYSIMWNTGQTTSTISNLSVGTYSVTVTDANNCTVTNSTMVVSNAPITINITQNSGTCTDANMGILVANVMGGTGAGTYTYQWSNGTTTQTNSNLSAGTYSVTVTDGNGCQNFATAAVTTFPSPSCSVNVLQTSNLGNNGSVEVNITGGVAPFNISWNTGATTAVLTGLAPGTYTATITDANGCQTTCSATLEPLAGLGNYVWEDIDHDGQQDPDEPVVPGVTVNLKDENGMVIATTITDENGEYYFLNLAPGTYSVQFVIPDGFDYTSSNMGDDALDNDIVPGMNGMTATYVLDPGELDFTIDGGIYVPPNGVISDPCSCLNNSTTDDNGQFLEVFTVRSYPNETWTVIDGEGMYSLEGGEPPLEPELLTFPFDMVEVEPGVYEFPFRLVDEITYTVFTTNGFDTLSISNTCEYPILNINELPPVELCLADAPIELGANPNIPGNLIFTINGEISTTIDPSLLDIGSYLLVATLVPVNPEECEATIETQFSITSDCLATVGNQVWLDLNCDGIQGGGEPGVPGIEVTITGTAEFLDPNINMTTFTDANGNYEFMVPPGNYKLTFGDVPGYDVTAPNQGGNDDIDSDVNPTTGMTEFFHLDPDEVNLTFDMGLCPECININYPGAIGSDQYLCAPGNTPEPFVSLAPATGGDGPVEYLWMHTNGSPGTPIQYWTPIPNSNSPTYAPGQVFNTTYYARCARTLDCGTFLESNVLVVEVGDETEAIINGPGLVCWNEPTTFTAEALPANADVTWNFTGGATPASVSGPTATVTYTNVGFFEVELIVTVDGCTAYAYKTLTITTSPTTCGQGLRISTDVMNDEAAQVRVSWEMNTGISGLTYHVEHATDGESFSRIATVTEAVETLNGIRYYEYVGTAPKRGINYYRVVVEDTQGNAAESNIEEVVLYTDSKIAMLYPNPVEDMLYLEIFENFGAEEVSVEVFSVSGKKLATLDVAPESNQVQIDFERFPAGAYLIRLVYGETNIRTMRVIKR